MAPRSSEVAAWSHAREGLARRNGPSKPGTASEPPATEEIPPLDDASPASGCAPRYRRRVAPACSRLTHARLMGGPTVPITEPKGSLGAAGKLACPVPGTSEWLPIPRVNPIAAPPHGLSSRRPAPNVTRSRRLPCSGCRPLVYHRCPQCSRMWRLAKPVPPRVAPG